MDTLSIIFGSQNKVKLLRLFLFNDNTVFDLDDISVRAKVDKKALKKEMISLEKIGCIKKKDFNKEVTKKIKDKEVKVSKKFKGWTYDLNFHYGDALRHLFSLATVSSHDDLTKRISTIGRIKFFVVAGVFIQDPESRVDMLVVGDSLKIPRLESMIRQMEAEIGREIRYSAFETPEFMYRMSLFDKLVRDVIDFPHKTLINKLNIES